VIDDEAAINPADWSKHLTLDLDQKTSRRGSRTPIASVGTAQTAAHARSVCASRVQDAPAHCGRCVIPAMIRA
jgi:hypothetical protein